MPFNKVFNVLHKHYCTAIFGVILRYFITTIAILNGILYISNGSSWCIKVQFYFI